MQEECFAPREHQKPQLEFDDILASMQTEITLRIHRSILDRVLDFCDDKHIESEGKEHYIVRFPFIENDYYYNILLGFGTQCQCLAPTPVRAQMKRRIHEMAALYET